MRYQALSSGQNGEGCARVRGAAGPQGVNMALAASSLCLGSYVRNAILKRGAAERTAMVMEALLGVKEGGPCNSTYE